MAKLTDTTLRTLGPDPDRKWHYDDLAPGLHFVPSRTRKGQGAFYTRYSVGRRRKRIKLGSYPGMKLADARKAARDIHIRVGGGDDPVAERKRQMHAGAFEAVVDEFIERYAKRHQRSWGETQRVLRKYAVPVLGDRLIGDIGRADINRLLDGVVDRNGTTQANRVYAYLSKLFNWAVDRGIVEDTPIRRGMKPGKEVKRDRVLSGDEVAAVWRAADAMGSPFGAHIKLLLLTGQRLREVARMRWDDIDSLDGDAPLWRIPSEATKAGRAHMVPLSGSAAKLLRDIRAVLPEGFAHVFVSGRNGDAPINASSKPKARVDTLSGVTGWRFHDLRRTMASNLADMGFGRDLIGLILNHADQGVTAIYDRSPRLDERRRAMDAWANTVEGLVEPGSRADNVVGLRREK